MFRFQFVLDVVIVGLVAFFGLRFFYWARKKAGK